MPLASTDIELAPAQSKDDSALAALRAQLSGAAPGEQAVSRARENMARNLSHGYRVTTFRAGETIIGYALWMDLGDHVFLRQFVIDEQSRGRGLGRTLFKRLLAEVFPRRREIRLEVMEGGPHGFWSALGFLPKTTGMRLTLDGEAA